MRMPMASLPTEEMRLSDTLIARLQAMAPKKKRRFKLRWVIVAALLAVVVSIGASRTMRELVARRLGFAPAPTQSTAAADAPASAASVTPAPALSDSAPRKTIVLSLDVTSDQPSASATPSASTAPSASAAPTTKKPVTKKPTTKPTTKKPTHNDGF